MDILSSREFTCLYESVVTKNGDKITNKNIICKMKNSKKISMNEQESECGTCPEKKKVSGSLKTCHIILYS